jgi:LysR family transcriptional regulator, nod-box dependent transcriptional activator
MKMNHKNLRAYNLNALPALREILRYGSLTKAAAALNLTQPALSNILKQLRRDFGDELVVRRGKSMQLTPRGEELMSPLEATLASVQQLLNGSTFNPSDSNKHFKIATTDHVMSVIGGPLLKRLIKDAPNARAHLIMAQEASIKALMVGSIDMVISPRILMSAGLAEETETAQVSMEHLFSEAVVCIGQEDDAELTAGLTPDEYLARPHAGFHFGDTRLSSLEQVQLSRMSLQQNNMLLTSSYAVLPCVVAETGCLALVPESLAQRAEKMCPIQIVVPPIDIPKMDWVMVWHKRNDNDAAHKWLRSVLIDEVTDAPGTMMPSSFVPSRECVDS